MIQLHCGDCLDKMKDLEDNSVDSIVTDPPYGLSFMGKHWDYDVPTTEIWKEALRVLKPGGHMLAFFGTRTYHRGVVRIEDAGFEIRDQIMWIYASGFPKSLNVQKAAFKAGQCCGCKTKTESQMPSVSNSSLSQTLSDSETEINQLQSSLSEQNLSSRRTERSKSETSNGKKSSLEGRSNLQKDKGELHRTEVCSVSEGIYSDGSQGWLHNGASFDNGKTPKQNITESGSCSPQGPQYKKQSDSKSGIISDQSSTQTCGSCGKKICDSGLGTALKPANEPIVLARKPLEKGLTVAENVLKWGCGAINIDESRIDADDLESLQKNWDRDQSKTMESDREAYGKFGAIDLRNRAPQGRWPANILFDEDAAAMLDEQSGERKSGAMKNVKSKSLGYQGGGAGAEWDHEGSSGGASRFFYVAKASKSERNKGLEGMPDVTSRQGMGGAMPIDDDGNERDRFSVTQKNHHPTVKPIKLMEYLCKLITPPKGIVLDPFMGSGSTGLAAKNLGFDFIGIEMNEEYFEIAYNRVNIPEQTDKMLRGEE